MQKIDEHTRILITDLAISDRSKSRGEVAEEVERRLEADRKPVPQRETLERLISHDRKHPQSPLQEPWSMASLKEYPIPPEALPLVLKGYVKCKVSSSILTRPMLPEDYSHLATWFLGPLTVRHALWIARLSGFCSALSTTQLLNIAVKYANAERISELTGKPFDTTALDSQLAQSLRADMLMALRIDEQDFDRTFPPPKVWGQVETGETVADLTLLNRAKANRKLQEGDNARTDEATQPDDPGRT